MCVFYNILFHFLKYSRLSLHKYVKIIQNEALGTDLKVGQNIISIFKREVNAQTDFLQLANSYMFPIIFPRR